MVVADDVADVVDGVEVVDAVVDWYWYWAGYREGMPGVGSVGDGLE